MGQKIHPTGFRLSVTRAWSSRWFATRNNFAGMLAEDLQVRDYLKTKLKNAAVSRVTPSRVRWAFGCSTMTSPRRWPARASTCRVTSRSEVSR